MTDIAENETALAICLLNDTLRSTGVGGSTVLSQGIAALPVEVFAAALQAVAAFDAFTAENDPYGKHDCASLDVQGHRIIWKIDYFDPDLRHHSDDPTEPAITRRVLTIMLAEEY